MSAELEVLLERFPGGVDDAFASEEHKARIAELQGGAPAVAELIPPLPPVPTETEAVPQSDDAPLASHDGFGRRVRWSGADLLTESFPPPRWAVEGLLPEGLTLLVGAPKLGKSWLALSMAVAVASGGTVLGQHPAKRGSALYLALEDSARRLQSRLRMMTDEHARPDLSGLDAFVSWPAMDDGGTEQLHAWLADHEDARLVIVDVLAKVRSADGSQQMYRADYEALRPFKDVADQYGVAVVVVHHARKNAADDFVHRVSGTHGLAGAADTVLLLDRSRSEADGELHITGRDVPESERALTFDSERGLWIELDGPPARFEMGATRRSIADWLDDNGSGTPKTISQALDLAPDLVRQTLSRMAKSGQIDTDGQGTYLPLAESSEVPPP